MISEPKMTQRREQAMETRRKLLDTAKALFAEHGYAETSVRMINRSIGMADGILYHHFPKGKAEILEVLLIENIEKALADVVNTNVELESLPLEEAVERMYELADDLFERNLDLTKIIAKERDTISIEFAQRFSELLHKRVEWLIGFLKRRHVKGEIREMDFEIAAEQLLANSLSSVFGKITGVQIGNVDAKQKRKRIIQHTLSLWKTS